MRHPRRYVCSGHKIHFNSRTSCEVRHDPRVQNAIPLTDFNSRTSCEVRHKSAAHKRRARKFQLTHLLRGATSSFRYSLCSYFISTHAPLARCDLMPFLRARARIDFNSRTSCEVRRTAYSSFPHYIDFNSRTSCEVRQRFNFVHRGELYFNSRTSCEVRLAQCVDHIDPPDFNSRTSCEVRLWRPAVPGRSGLFQLTHLLRGATIRRIAKIKNADFNSRTSCEVRRFLPPCFSQPCISTHAPLARCDIRVEAVQAGQGYFTSRTSCEVRRVVCVGYIEIQPQFQLTHLLRGATSVNDALIAPPTGFQLTHLLRGATSTPCGESRY